MSHQDLRSEIREIRKDCLKAIEVVHHIESKIQGSRNVLDSMGASRLGRSIDDTHHYLQHVRNSLRVILEYSDTSGCLSDPEIDKPESHPHPSGPPCKIFRSLSVEIKERSEDLEGLLGSFVEYYLEGFAVRHFEEAVMKLQVCSQSLAICSHLLSNEKSNTKEEKRGKGSSDNILSSDKGFQAAARPR